MTLTPQTGGPPQGWGPPTTTSGPEGLGKSPAGPLVPRRKRRPKDIGTAGLGEPWALPKGRAMTNRSKAIGTACETAVVRYLQANGWPSAERRALRGAQDAGDVTGTPGVCWSVKGGNAARDASDLDVSRWLDDLDDQALNAGADLGVLVLQRRGVGPANAGRWWALMRSHILFHLLQPGAWPSDQAPNPVVRMTLADAARLLRWAQYGKPLEVPGA